MNNIVITKEILLANGFVEVNQLAFDGDVSYTVPNLGDIDFKEHDDVFIEQEFGRNLIAIVLTPDEDYSVWIQINVGCGFIKMPFRWCELTVARLNDLYRALHDKPLFDGITIRVKQNKEIGM